MLGEEGKDDGREMGGNGRGDQGKVEVIGGGGGGGGKGKRGGGEG